MASTNIQRGPPMDISVIISGAGVGGLFAALELWRQGCSDIRIFERAPKTQTQGDSFNIGPTAINAFRNWPEMEARNEAIAYSPMIAFHNQKGERVSGPFTGDDVISQNVEKEKRPKKMYRHSRPKFHQMLLEQLAKIGLKVEYGMVVEEYSEDVERKKAAVVLADGSRHEADLVIAADGVRGKSWQLVAGEPIPAKSTGNAVLRVAYPVDLALADPEVAERFKLTEDGTSIAELWTGPNFHCVFWRNEDEMQWAIDHVDAGSAEESWSHRVDPKNALQYVSHIDGWPEYATKVFLATPPDQLVDWKLMWRDPQPKNTSPAGLVVQLGDAAHTFLPSSGNGATQAIEDAVSLATCLSVAGSKASIPDATRTHNLLRFERISCLQAFGVKNRENRKDHGKKPADSASSPDAPQKPPKSQKPQISFGKWIVDHDPEAYARENYAEARSHLQNGTPFKSTNTPPGMVYKPWTIEGLMDAQARGEPTILDGDWD